MFISGMVGRRVSIQNDIQLPNMRVKQSTRTKQNYRKEILRIVYYCLNANYELLPCFGINNNKSNCIYLYIPSTKFAFHYKNVEHYKFISSTRNSFTI